MKLVYVIKKDDLKMTYKKILQNKLLFSSTLISRLKACGQIRFVPPIYSIHQYPQENAVIEAELVFSKSNIVPIEGNIDILYEDNFFLFVNKPAGLPSHPSKGHYFDTISNYVEYYLNSKNLTSHVVNRLDKDTSGIVVFAKNSYFHSIVSLEFEQRRVEKTYIAIVHGKLEEKNGFIEKPIKRSSEGIKREVHQDGSFASTYYEVIDFFKDYSLLKLKPITGRTHQLRVHLASIGHPIVGDNIYGKKTTQTPYLLLHAYSIKFVFKLINNKIYNIIAPLPHYFHEFAGKDLEL